MGQDHQEEVRPNYNFRRKWRDGRNEFVFLVEDCTHSTQHTHSTNTHHKHKHNTRTSGVCFPHGDKVLATRRMHWHSHRHLPSTYFLRKPELVFAETYPSEFELENGAKNKTTYC